MGNKKLLTPHQEALLQQLEVADITWRERKATAELEARKAAERAIAEIANERLRLVLLAQDSGIPKTRIGVEGLHSQDPRIVNNLLKKHENQRSMLLEIYRPSEFKWENQERGEILVNIPSFPTAAESDDYPDVLSGVVKRNGDEWEVLRDDSDQIGPFGTVPGWLRWEVAPTTPHVESRDLRVKLDAWLEGKQ